MTSKQTIIADVLYTNGDSWVHGSELVDPTSDVTDQFAVVHEDYRKAHYFPRLLADALGLELVDGSMAGAGNDYISRTTLRDVTRLKMEGRKPFVLLSWSQLQRFELPDQHGDFYRPYVSTDEAHLPRAVVEIWAKHSSDKSDLVRWLHQLIMMDSFLKVNGVPYFGTSVFPNPYTTLESFIEIKDFEEYAHQLTVNVDLTRHMLNFSLKSILLQYNTVAYGLGGHPLEDGHKLLARYLQAQLEQRYTIKTTQAPR
jgi:hypothetical protein